MSLDHPRSFVVQRRLPPARGARSTGNRQSFHRTVRGSQPHTPSPQPETPPWRYLPQTRCPPRWTPLSETRSSPHPGCRDAGACRRPLLPRVVWPPLGCVLSLPLCRWRGIERLNRNGLSCYRRAVVSAWPLGHTFLATGRCCVASSSSFFWSQPPLPTPPLPFSLFFLLPVFSLLILPSPSTTRPVSPSLSTSEPP